MTVELAWWTHLQTVRWFGGKGTSGRISALEPLRWYTPPDAVPAVRSEIATLEYDDGHTEHYHLLVAHYPAGSSPVPALATDEDADIVDATADPGAVRAFVTAVQDSPGEAMQWHRPLRAMANTEIGVWAGEQSNTTLTLADQALFKLFRRIEPGPNLDAEVLTALNGTHAATPALFGRLTAPWPPGLSTDLGMVIERVPRATDGWELASAACAAGVDFTAEARALGAALALVHTALREAFGSHTAKGSDIAAVMLRRLQAAVAAAPALAPYRDALAASFDALRGVELEVQRVHGDFHLGQTLRSPSGWTIIDFEGEPAKTAAERRAPDSVWRDVAGMLRSFDYARSAHPHPASAEAQHWAIRACAAFCDGYCGEREIPVDVLASYEVDKAIYEVVYETRNRPEWVHIPMTAVDRVASIGRAGASAAGK